jgi:CTD kinase subunit gamma
VFKYLIQTLQHKRLRERRWVQPIPAPNSEAFSAASIPRLTCFLPTTAQGLGDNLSALAYEDVEFENAWETTSDWNEDDDEDIQAENELCFPGQYIGYRDGADEMKDAT